MPCGDLDIPQVHASVQHGRDGCYLYWILKRPWQMAISRNEARESRKAKDSSKEERTLVPAPPHMSRRVTDIREARCGQPGFRRASGQKSSTDNESMAEHVRVCPGDPHTRIMWVTFGHLRPSGHIMPDHAGDRGTAFSVMAPHDHLHIKQMRALAERVEAGRPVTLLAQPRRTAAGSPWSRFMSRAARMTGTGQVSFGPAARSASRRTGQGQASS